MRSLLLKNTETHKNPYRKITYLLTRWLSLNARATKQKRRTTNVSRRDISISYVAIHRIERDCYCTQGMAEHGRLAIKLLLLLVCDTKK